MQGSARYKIPGGKLVEVRLRYNASIERIEILGDFFIYPEESVSLIEDSLLRIDADASEGAMADKIKKVADTNGIEMIGITAGAIAKAVKMAMSA